MGRRAHRGGARRWSSGRSAPGGSARTRSRPPSPPSTPTRPTAAATDWRQIAALYDALLAMTPSPVVELNRAVAVAMRDGPAAGLALIDAILGRGELADYHLAHAARADLLRRLGSRATPRPRTSGRWRWPGRSRSGDSSRSDFRSCNCSTAPELSSPAGDGKKPTRVDSAHARSITE